MGPLILMRALLAGPAGNAPLAPAAVLGRCSHVADTPAASVWGTVEVSTRGGKDDGPKW
jgi:hypothetical protein